MEEELLHTIDEPAMKRHLLGTATQDDVANLEPRPMVPNGTGPLPPELGARARALLVAQSQAIERLEGLRKTTGRHLAAMRAIPPHRDARSVYLDIAG